MVGRGKAGNIISSKVMVHTGATVVDYMPYGNLFHVSVESVKMSIKDRMKLMPFESIVGGTMTIVATIVYGFLT